MLSRRLFIQSRASSVSTKFSWDEVRDYYKHKYHNGTSERNGKGEVFKMVLPPPNVTGVLHIGHALTVTVEDAICRFQRLNDRNVEWIPGFDHAGIATQTAVEKMLWKTRRVRRHELSSDDFLEHCLDWKEVREKEISNQLRQLGTTLDWSRPFYTMNNKFKTAVNTAFVQLEKDGLIYRDKRIINWCPSLRSAISNEEVDLTPVGGSVTIPNPKGGMRKVKVGVMYKVRYKLVDRRHGDPEYLEVATTRPESVFADTALAVNPKDPRFFGFIGRFVKNPMSEEQIPVIPSELVDPDLGTGVLKVTPACSPVDYRIYSDSAEEFKRKMRLIPVTDDAGNLTKFAGKFEGLDRFDAKEKVVKFLTRIEAFGGEEKVEKTVLPICSRSGDLCEGRLMDQWFLRTKELNTNVLERLEKGEIKIDPDYGRFALSDWLENHEPWCLSRQLVWGHRIPAYFDDSGNYFSAIDLDEAEEKSGIPKEKLTQDPDVLDTWFSSALIPIVVGANWPKTRAVGQKPPIDLMETGHDITGFWVARMLILCYGLTGKLPFDKISLHGMIRDSEGRKMSKSRGNVIDPLFLINGASLNYMIKDLKESNLPEEELASAIKLISKDYPKGIQKYGPDVLRFVLLRRDVQAKDVPVDLIPLAEEGFKFGNKLANMTKYVDLVCTANAERSKPKWKIEDKWIKSRLKRTAQIFYNNMSEAKTHPAFEAVFQFILNDICDTYLESTKKALWQKDPARLAAIRSTLVECVEISLKMWSTFMPMVSNYLLDHSKNLENRAAIEFEEIVSDFDAAASNSLDRNVRTAQNIITALRAVRARLGFSEKTPLSATVMSRTLDKKFIEDLGEFVENTGNIRLRKMETEKDVSENINVVTVPGTDIILVLDLDNEVGEDEDFLKKKL
uniref:valine--tRNA ligase n=1 Tax=Bursaphelenchus xylophilus TaxID=6326 RepID=A0A1I7RME6_BURXY